MNAKETVNALSNLRPQHLTEALLLPSIPEPTQTGLAYVRSEFYQEEPDNSAQGKRGQRIVRGYYLLEEISQPVASDARLVRRFWFDRVNGIRLARVQSFDNAGLLTTDVSYWEEKPYGEAAQLRLPSRIEITRPHDQYKLSITYQAPPQLKSIENTDLKPLFWKTDGSCLSWTSMFVSAIRLLLRKQISRHSY